MARVPGRWATIAVAATVASGMMVGTPAGATPPACGFPREVNIHGPSPRNEGTSNQWPPVTSDFVFTVTTRWCAQPGTVKYETVGLKADPGTDFVAASGTLTFVAGDASPKSITVRVWQDALLEKDEGVLVCLYSPTGWVEINTRSASTVFVNDDGPTPPSHAEPEAVCSR